MQSIIATLLMIFTPLMATQSEGESPFFGAIEEDSVVPEGDYLLINSPGGLVNKSFELLPDVEGKTCIVFNAASAALMIILPACKERYYVKNANLVFHSAVYFLFFAELNQWNAEWAAQQLREANERVLLHMVSHQIPFTPEVLNYHMQQNTWFHGEDIKVWEPWILPVEQCTHCPDWTKMLQLKPASTTQSSESDDGREDSTSSPTETDQVDTPSDTEQGQ